MRESPTFKLMELLEERGAERRLPRPLCAGDPRSREHPDIAGRRSVPLDRQSSRGVDVVLICTDHDGVD